MQCKTEVQTQWTWLRCNTASWTPPLEMEGPGQAGAHASTHQFWSRGNEPVGSRESLHSRPIPHKLINWCVFCSFWYHSNDHCLVLGCQGWSLKTPSLPNVCRSYFTHPPPAHHKLGICCPTLFLWNSENASWIRTAWPDLSLAGPDRFSLYRRIGCAQFCVSFWCVRGRTEPRSRCRALDH